MNYLNQIKNFIKNFEVYFDLKKISLNKQELEKLTLDTNFWNNPKNAQKILKEITVFENEIKFWDEIDKKYADIENDNAIKQYDPLVASLKETRKRNREMNEAKNLEQLYISDVSHRPIIILTMLGIVFTLASINALISGQNALILLMVGLFASILVAIAKYRSKTLEINLLHVLGIEIPIAVSICGLVIIHNISHIGLLSSNTEMLDISILAIIKPHQVHTNTIWMLEPSNCIGSQPLISTQMIM